MNQKYERCLKVFNLQLPYMHESVCVCVSKTQYQNKNTAVFLSDAITGEPTIRVSTNVENLFLPPNMFVCKNYSENEGLDVVLETAGIATCTGIKVKTGFCICPIMQLTEEL